MKERKEYGELSLIPFRDSNDEPIYMQAVTVFDQNGNVIRTGARPVLKDGSQPSRFRQPILQGIV